MSTSSSSDITFYRQEKDLLKKVWSAKDRYYIILDNSIVHRLGIDSDSFFQESINEKGHVVLKHIRNKSEFTGVET
jgi:hypothetical protein